MSGRSFARVLALVMVLLLGLAGLGACTGRSSGGSSTAGSAQGETENAAAAETEAAAAAPAAGKAQADTASSASRAVVRTASMAVTAADVDVAANRIGTLAASHAGRVDGDDREGTGPDRSATLTVRVVPAALDATMTAVAGLGRETSRSLQAQDVTQSTVDLAARVAALRASVTRLRQLLTRSATVTGLLDVEKQLSTREADLESLTAQRSSLAGRVALASLTVTVTATTPAAVKRRTGVHPTGFLAAFGAGVHAISVGVLLVVAALGYVLPALIPLVLLAVLARLWWRRGHRAPAGSGGL